MIKKSNIRNSKRILKYTLFGIAIGMLFPIFSTIIDSYDTYNVLSMNTIMNIQSSNYVHLVMDCVPLFFGFFAFLSGYKHEKIDSMNDLPKKDLMSNHDRIKSSTLNNSTEGQLNHSFFIHQLKQTIAVSSRYNLSFALLSLNLKNFEEIIHTDDHTKGEEYILEILNHIKAKLRTSDLICRFKVNDFYILLLDIYNYQNVTKIVDNIINTINSFQFSDHAKRLECNIGISFYPNDGKDINKLLHSATYARLMIKSQKSSYKLFNEHFETTIKRKHSIVKIMREAIDNCEFEIHFQPQHDENLNIVGSEVLLRWNSLPLGQVNPSEFIPIAEENGMISDIGYWVLEETCRYCKTIDDFHSKNIQIAINISYKQLIEKDFYNKFMEIIEITKLDPSFLEIEITESCLSSKEDDALKVLSLFSEKGIQISIDDFGTGYSSLSRILEFPIDKIKIDKSFVASITKNKKNMTLVKSIINLAHSLDMKVVAEGVETETQFQVLKDLNCTIFQGFLHHPPDEFKVFKKLVNDSVYSCLPKSYSYLV